MIGVNVLVAVWPSMSVTLYTTGVLVPTEIVVNATNDATPVV